jgi:hypothetical protein
LLIAEEGAVIANFVHPKVTRPISISGKAGDDAHAYQETAVRLAIEESKK